MSIMSPDSTGEEVKGGVFIGSSVIQLEMLWFLCLLSLTSACCIEQPCREQRSTRSRHRGTEFPFSYKEPRALFVISHSPPVDVKVLRQVCCQGRCRRRTRGRARTEKVRAGILHGQVSEVEAIGTKASPAAHRPHRRRALFAKAMTESDSCRLHRCQGRRLFHDHD